MWLFGPTTLATPPEVITGDFRDVRCIAWALHDEARGEPLKGKRAVFDVIKRRMQVRKKTACEVVKEPKQFSGYKRGRKLVVTNDMLTTYDKVSKMQPVVPKAEYFHAKYVKPTWAAKMKRVMTIGLHHFYVVRPNPEQKEKQK